MLPHGGCKLFFQLASVSPVANFQITADANYHITNIKTGGVDISGSPYSGQGFTSTNFTWANITVDSTIEATFAINTQTITASKVGSGSISPTGAVSVDYNSTKSLGPGSEALR